MKKLLKLAVTFVTMLTICMLFAVISSAATYTVKYCQIDGSSKATVKTDDNGVITLRDTSVTTTDGKEFYGWFTDDGTFYPAGTQLTLTKDTNFREAYAYVVSSYDEFKTYCNSKYQRQLIKLGADITVTDMNKYPGSTSNNGGLCIFLDLNGHTITSGGTGSLFNGTRLYLSFLNSAESQGKIIANTLSSSDAVFNYVLHGSADGKNIGITISKNVYVETTGALFRIERNMVTGETGTSPYAPRIRIWGTLVADSLVNAYKKKTYLADIDFYKGSDITFTGETLWTNPCPDYPVKFIDLGIENGAKITTTNPNFNWIPSADYIQYATYSVTGGSFSAVPQDGILKNGYHAVYNAETGYYDVQFVPCTLDGSNGEHNFVAKDPYEGMAASCVASGVYYFRCECGDYYIDAIDAVGHDFSIVTILTPATSTQAGTKKYSCARCKDDSVSYTLDYVVDASQSLVSVTVKTADGTKTIMVPFTDLFTITNEDDGTVTLNSIANTITISEEESYTKADIVILNIPNGITNVATGAIKDMTALEIINVIDGAKVTFETASIDTCVSLEKLVLDDCVAIFKQFTVKGTSTDTAESSSATVTTPTCPNFAIIDAKNADVTFEAYAFRFNGAIKQVLMGTNHTYNFKKFSFHRSSIEEVVIPDGASVTLELKCFAETTTLEYVYIGKGCIAPNSNGEIHLGSDNTHYSIFGGSAVLSKVVLMDVTYVAKWVFSVKTSGDYVAKSDLYIYSHADSITFNDAAFNDRNKTSHIVYIYVQGSTNLSFANCKYVMFVGIPHRYTKTESLPTCTTPGSTGYSTDCPCGVIPAVGDEPLTYSVITNTTYEGEDKDGGSISIESTTPATGHSFTVLVSQTEAECGARAVATYKCANCDETQRQEVGEIKEHTYGEWEVVIAPTCTVDGERQQRCVDCLSVANAEIISAPGHTEGEWQIIIAPGCELYGTKELYCTECNELVASDIITPLGHEFDVADGATVPSCKYPNGYDKEGTLTTKCARCTITQDTTLAPLFEAKGYSIKNDGTALIGDFRINQDALEAYNAYLVGIGKDELVFGIVMSNGALANGLTFDSEYKLTSAYGIQLVATSNNYAKLNYTITGFDPADSMVSLDLTIAIYVIDENGMSFIQRETALDGTTTATVNGGTPVALKSINLGKIAELLIPTVEADETLPAETKQKFLEILAQIKATANS